MKKLIVTVVILLCILASVLFFFGRAGDITRASSAQSQGYEAAAEGIVYVSYAGTFLTLDKSFIVCGNSREAPKDIPQLEGIEFSKLVYGKAAQPKEPSALEYAISVALELKKNDITADAICYASRKITVISGGLTIKLGKNELTSEKIKDLSNFIDQIADESGVLDMQNGNADNYGYTFRPSHAAN